MGNISFVVPYAVVTRSMATSFLIVSFFRRFTIKLRSSGDPLLRSSPQPSLAPPPPPLVSCKQFGELLKFVVLALKTFELNTKWLCVLS